SVAGRDAAVDLPKPAEQHRGLARLAGFQQFADLGRGINRRILAADWLDHGHLETVLQTRGPQKIGRPTATVAERAIPADDNMRGADRSDDDFGDELLGTFLRKGQIEMLDEQQIDAEPSQFAL